MERITYLIVLGVALVLSSCANVYVAADYDRQADFSAHGSFALLKERIDKAPILDLDKKYILHTIEKNLTNKGAVVSDNSDSLVNIFTREHENVGIYNNSLYYWGWGWNWRPFWGGATYNINGNTEGALYIEVINARKHGLVWQGKGSGPISYRSEQKGEAISNFINKVLEQYPPG